ncbi:hypothetical protein BFW01_g12762 [Lasiodiplodia theobromae]|uniref:uncharacterized protein n=1 Tax=Lasiodiplodia theobromae TaxID=45133 RepID=UPI0015C30BED|nr:uncharacterized protein LTHEOB_8483 [Lasiodiplodia theobromae]KAF4541488.1 hypothetical protein LTHEOB_8483 [Lasiodiplodia theobromae]KAF9640956.1 hypothetical protein BFW01_g12762 [Lasiodiplodia theobromae]
MAPGDISDCTPTAALVTPHPAHPQQRAAKQQPAAPVLTSTSGSAASDGNINDANTKTVADYLAAFPHLTDLDKRILALPSDDHFTPHSWTSLRQLIAANDLHLLTRSPSQTRAYLDWTSDVRRRFGSITNYLLRERLRWTPAVQDEVQGIAFACADPTPFAHPDDFLVLRNDWPYGLDPGIVHICVWLKTPLDLKPEDGDLTDRARDQVEDFVTATFRVPLGEGTKGERVLWFKNWAQLQSVRGVDHVHVLIKDAPPELLEGWMN